MLRTTMMVAALSAMMAGSVAAQAQGRTIFEGKGNCWTCHGRDAKGTPLGPNLTDGEWIYGDGSLDSIRVVVQRGVAKPQKYPAPMPPMGGARLNQAEIDAVATYVRSLQLPSDTTAGRPVSGVPVQAAEPAHRSEAGRPVPSRGIGKAFDRNEVARLERYVVFR